MAAMVQGKLRKVKPSARNVVEKHKEILDQVVRELKDPPALKEGLQAFFTAVVDENLGIVNSKSLMSYFAEQIPSVTRVVAKDVCEFALTKIHGRIVSFEEQATQIRLALAKLHEDDQNWRESAQVLCGIPMDSGQKIYSGDFKMEVYLRIARLYLEEQDHVSAESQRRLITARMIGEGRMTGSIDQIDGIVYFKKKDMLPSWDARIRSVCFQVNAVVHKISARHPGWVQTSLDSQMAH